MNIKKIYILILLLFFVKMGNCQDVPLSQRLIEEGYGYLEGYYSQGTPEDAKKSFKRAKRLFFYKNSVVNDAKLGLSEYYLVVQDTSKSIKILNSIIGKRICLKIENSEFDKLKETKKDDWDTYDATSKRIKIALNQKKFILAKNYLKYFKEYVKVTWYCGIGSLGHDYFIENAEKTLAENGY